MILASVLVSTWSSATCWPLSWSSFASTVDRSTVGSLDSAMAWMTSDVEKVWPLRLIGIIDKLS